MIAKVLSASYLDALAGESAEPLTSGLPRRVPSELQPLASKALPNIPVENKSNI